MLSRQPAPIAAPVAGLTVAAPAVKLFPVVVTSKAIPAGQVIAADSLQIAQLPIKPGGAFTDTAPLAGRVAIFDLAEGTPLQENQLASGLALHLADGERAVAIKADEVMGVGNKVQVGDYVDVFVMLKSDGKDIERSQSRLLLARKRVLAFGNASVDGLPSRIGDSKTAAEGAAPSRTERPEPARTAVLAVPVDEVNRLTIGDNSGRLMLALRNPADLSEPDPKLFADLPGALQPVAAQKGVALTGINRAQAGLVVADLSSTSGPSASTAQARAAFAAPRPLASTGSRPAARSSGLEVEIIRGDKRELTTY